MNDAFDIRGESHIEVHKFRAGAIIAATLLALLFQSSFPIHFAKAAVLDLPLLVTIYFGLSRRNPSTGLLLGRLLGFCRTALADQQFPWDSTVLRKPSSGISLHLSGRGSIPSTPLRASPSPSRFSSCIRDSSF